MPPRPRSFVADSCLRFRTTSLFWTSCSIAAWRSLTASRAGSSTCRGRRRHGAEIGLSSSRRWGLLLRTGRHATRSRTPEGAAARAAPGRWVRSGRRGPTRDRTRSFGPYRPRVQTWDRSRWPGKSGRLTYTATIYAVFVFRQIEQLSLRIWDDGAEGAEERLLEVQRLLDRLNVPPNPSAFVRDARWLIETAQGPLTRRLSPYFTIAGHVAASFKEERRLELHKAGAKLAGGHLRSQLRYREWNSGRPADDPEVVAFSRSSNSMDLALLIGDLVPLLEAYRNARAVPDSDAAANLADAILQGCSADPELCLTRLDLLWPYHDDRGRVCRARRRRWPRGIHADGRGARQAARALLRTDRRTGRIVEKTPHGPIHAPVPTHRTAWPTGLSRI